MDNFTITIETILLSLVMVTVLSYPQQTIFSNVPAIDTAAAPDPHQSQILTPLANAGDVVNSKIDQAINSQGVQIVTPFPDSGRQGAVLESAGKESIPIQADIKYGGFQQFVANLFNPRPIVDTTREYEKYGNDGGKGRAFGTFVVGAFEGLSNALNAVVNVPFEATKTVGRKITESLNQVGSKLVGLA